MPIFNLDVFSEFPRCCEHYWSDPERTDNAYFNDDTGLMESAFYCPGCTGHRIVESECQGQSCLCCKLVGFDEYQRLLE